MEAPISFSGIVSQFLTFSPFLIALIYLFSAARKRKSIAGANQNKNECCDVVDKSSCCALCGKAEIGEVKLVPCDDCDLVRYCSDECKKDHKSEHEEECKKRASELRDELLFKQPESSHLGDCPLCFLPLSLDIKKSVMYTCCCTIICGGCTQANAIRDKEERLQRKCSFCREPVAKTDKENDERRMKRIEANDPVAMSEEGACCYNKGEYSTAFEYYKKAAALGNAGAHNRLARLYRDGEGVEMDKGKEIHHPEEAAIGGHAGARYDLGHEEWKRGNFERAVKHLIIAATQGNNDAIKVLMIAFKCGFMKKEDLAAALRAHQAAVDETKSPQREVAEVLLSKYRSLESETS